MRRILRRFGPLAPVLEFFLWGLGLWLLSRLILSLIYSDRVAAVEQGWRVFLLGLRMDIITLSMLSFFPAVLILLLPARWGHYWRPVLAGFFALCAALMVYLEIATLPFIQQYDVRPDRVFLEYLVYPKEVFATLWAQYKLVLLLATAVLVLTARWMWRRSRRSLQDSGAAWSYRRRLAVLPLVVLALAAGARSSLDHRPANISTAAFSNDHLVNDLALNSTYSVAYAAYLLRHEQDAAKLYGHMPEAEMYQRVYRHMGLPAERFSNRASPLLHRQVPPVVRHRPYNLVIILEESLGAEYVGSLGGLPLTPEFDRLSRQGMLLTKLYSTGTRTVRGIEATVSGFLPTAGRSVVKLGKSQHRFFSLAALLKQHGYTSDFIYGGAAHFDNMRGFLLGNGFDRVVDETDFEQPAMRGTWGVSDEDLMRKANAVFAAHGEQPFFGLVLSTSNHSPFEFPAGRIEPFEQPLNTVHNAIQYADYAIGEFFRLAQAEAYYENTIFLVVADHNTRVYGADLVPVDKFHIPGLILGPGVPAQRLARLASQIDLAPTLLGLLGVVTEHPMPGHDLLNPPAGTPGHAFMQYGRSNAYRLGDQVVITQPGKPAQQFRYGRGGLTPVAANPELVRDALAHIQLPSVLYQRQAYALPHSR